MGSSTIPCILARIGNLEALAEDSRRKQKDPQWRNAREWYVKAEDRHYFNISRRMNKETAKLAATSKAVGEKALLVGGAALVIGVVCLALQTRAAFRA